MENEYTKTTIKIAALLPSPLAESLGFVGASIICPVQTREEVIHAFRKLENVHEPLMVIVPKEFEAELLSVKTADRIIVGV